jgi:hypothetical protein
MGRIHLAVPDSEAEINLYHLAQNQAWLKTNDSTNWSRYTFLNENESGSLHRFWDSQGLNYYSLSISGQKHIDESKIFYGDIRYNVDIRKKVNRALDKYPYDLDPFVLTDTTAGQFEYLGPRLSVAFNHQLFSDFYYGMSIDYAVNRGLKDIYTEPEVISRYIGASLDFVYRLSSTINLGLTNSVYHLLDITKLTLQSDGQTPQTYRYRGLFEFRKSTGTKDRNSTYWGYQFCPQISLASGHLETVFYMNYRYRWHDIYDGTTTRSYEGSYQEQSYGFRIIGRYYLSRDRSTALTADYHYNYIDNWAKEAVAGLLIHKGDHSNQFVLVGAFHKFDMFPILTAVEISYDHSQPKEEDYLAKKAIDGSITKLDIRLGLELEAWKNRFLRGGYNYINYKETDVWDYYGDFQGHILTGGIGLHFSSLELDIYGRYGRTNRKIDDASRWYYDFIIQLKHQF